jgi:hypothetical protein
MNRKPAGYLPINPKIRNNFLDSCAFDPKYTPEDAASLKILDLYKKGLMVVNIAHSNQKEIEHPNTPSWVKKEASALIYSLKTNLTEPEIKQKSLILSILAGNGKPENMEMDAEHVFEASKYGSYFITTDERILKKKSELEKVCSANIVKPSELLQILEIYEST